MPCTALGALNSIIDFSHLPSEGGITPFLQMKKIRFREVDQSSPNTQAPGLEHGMPLWVFVRPRALLARWYERKWGRDGPGSLAVLSHLSLRKEHCFQAPPHLVA